MNLLFLSTGNACCSLMAEGWVRYFASKSVSPLQPGIRSAGLETHGFKRRGENWQCIRQLLSSNLRQGIEIVDGSKL